MMDTKIRKLIVALLIALAILLPFPAYGVTHVPPTHIYCVGDSLTAASYPYYLNLLQTPNRIVINDGVNGNTASQMLARFADNVTSLSAPGDYVVIWGGINDAGAGVDNITIKTNLQSMYDSANTAGLKVVALTISPFKNASYWTIGRGVQADAVSAWIRAKPSHVDYVVDIHASLQDPADHDAINPTYDYGDHLHYNDAGLQLIANTIYNTVWPTITIPLSGTGYATYIKATTLSVGNLIIK